MEINQEKIEAAIIEQAVQEIVSDKDVYDRVKIEIENRINAIFQKSSEKQIANAVEAAIKQGFDHAYCKVDYLGRPVGSPTTVAAELNRMINGYWNQPVDKQGKPTDSSYSSFGTRAEWTMAQLVADDFKGNMKQHIVNLGGALKDALRISLHETVNKLLSEVFYVRTEDDKKSSNEGKSIIHPETSKAIPK
jgi:hypothetical protein